MSLDVNDQYVTRKARVAVFSSGRETPLILLETSAIRSSPQYHELMLRQA